MDPTLNSLAHKLLAEEAAQPAQAPTDSKRLLHRLGGLLVTLGETMQSARLQMSLDFEKSRGDEQSECICQTQAAP